ncbi:CRISPR-associated protein Csx16 [Neptunomonas sp.]|uniref:CRISPR-associated protein Csx16 n=1 Tax=Neptunomonas sp. TaxID=1971898 RepID=UPI00356AFC85
MPKNYLVSRHPAAIDWISQQMPVDQVITHLDINLIEVDDAVIGTLPIHVAAQVCERQAKYVHLSLDIPSQWRGKELDTVEFKQCAPRLEEFSISREKTDNESR